MLGMKNGTPGYYLSFSLDEVRTILIGEFEEEILDDFINIRKLKELNHVPDLIDVIYSYLLKLDNFGYLRKNDSKDKFKTKFIVIT
jgi:hypothetical protein